MVSFSELSLYSRLAISICALLGLVIAAEAVVLSIEPTSRDELAPTEQIDENLAAAIARPLQIPPVVAYREIVERPLFSDTRRPPNKAVTVAAAEPTATLSSSWKLTGVVVAGENSFVHVVGIRDHKTVRLQVGMPLDGWRLESIESDHVNFASAGRTATLRLYDEDLPIAPLRRQ